jgi:hypothetical protein
VQHSVSARLLLSAVQVSMQEHCQLCNTVSMQEHYFQLCNSQHKNTTVGCATVSARTLLSAVQVSMQEHYCQLCNTVSMQEHYCQLCNSQCKNTTVSCTSVNARTLLSAVQVSMQEHYCQLCNSQCKNTSISCVSVNTRTLLSAWTIMHLHHSKPAVVVSNTARVEKYAVRCVGWKQTSAIAYPCKWLSTMAGQQDTFVRVVGFRQKWR